MKVDTIALIADLKRIGHGQGISNIDHAIVRIAERKWMVRKNELY